MYKTAIGTLTPLTSHLPERGVQYTLSTHLKAAEVFLCKILCDLEGQDVTSQTLEPWTIQEAQRRQTIMAVGILHVASRSFI